MLRHAGLIFLLALPACADMRREAVLPLASPKVLVTSAEAAREPVAPSYRIVAAPVAEGERTRVYRVVGLREGVPSDAQVEAELRSLARMIAREDGRRLN